MARGVITLVVYCVFIFTELDSRYLEAPPLHHYSSCTVEFRINDHSIALLSLVGLLLYHVLTFPWPFFTDHVKVYNDTCKLVQPVN